MIAKSIHKFLYNHPLRKLPPDKYIQRLRSSVIGEGMLHEGNIYLFDYAIKNLPSEVNILEIGTYGGLSTNLILYLLKKHSKKNVLFGCDPWVYESSQKGSTEQQTGFIDGSSDVRTV